jgi:predicted type IV restriction endonuclease
MVKAKNVDILDWEYIKEEDKYAITFKIRNLEPKRIQRIIKRHKSGFLNSQGVDIEEIAEIDCDLYVKEYYTNEDIENYQSIIPLVRKSIIPERLDPQKLEIEVEMCMIEQEMRYRIEHAGESVDELKNL